MARKSQASPLTSHIGYWMRLVSNHVSYSFAEKLAGQGVTVAEWVILREMYEAGDTTNPSVIARMTGLTRGAISKLIVRLTEKKLVTRREAGSDRRFQDIQLTKAGRSIVPRLADLADANDQEFFSALTSSERVQLTAALKKLAHFHHFKTIPIE